MMTQDLQELQAYIWQKNIDRGFSEESAERKMLMLTEEVGELAKAVRQHIGMGFSETTSKSEAAEELADVLIITLGLASTLKIDIFEALVGKETKNAKRKWK
jgi:NTP pyrophosphatase (non-canonical NTP hydrolase)